MSSATANGRDPLPVTSSAQKESYERSGEPGHEPAGSDEVLQVQMPAANLRSTPVRATAQEVKAARARLGELEEQLQFVGRLEATLQHLQRGYRAPSVNSSGSSDDRLKGSNGRPNMPRSERSPGSSHGRTANENPSAAATRADFDSESMVLDSARTGSPIANRYHADAAHDWALPNSSDGGNENESQLAVQKGRNSIENGQKSELDPLDEEEEMLRRVNSVITSVPEGGHKSLHHGPNSSSNNPVQSSAVVPKGSIMLAMTLDQLREIVKEEVKESPLAASGRTRNPRVAWDSDADEKNSQANISRVSSSEKPKRAIGATQIPKNLEDAVPVSCRSNCYSGFTRQSPIRMKCFDIAKDAKWATFFLIVTIANSIYIAVFPGQAAAAEESAGVTAGEAFDYFCVAVFVFEISVSIIAFGFSGSPTTWLENSDFHKLDLFVVIATLAEYVLSSFGFRGATVRPFRLLRIFKAMVKIRTFSAIKAIIATLKQGMSQLLIVFSILLFFVACAGIFGMAILQNSFARRCVSADRQIPACASDFSTGWGPTCDMRFPNTTITEPSGELIRSPGYPGYLLCKIMYNESEGEYDGQYPLDMFGRYHTCQLDLFKTNASAVTQYCEVIENPNFGFQHFDHIGGAILAIFQIAAPDGSYDVIHSSIQSEPGVEPALWTFFFLISCLCTFLLLGLFVAVVTGTFKRVREGYGLVFNQGQAPLIEELKSGSVTPTESEADKQYHEPVPGSVLSDNLKSYSAAMPELISSQEIDTETMIQIKAHKILYGNRFKHFMSIVILLHGIVMAFDRYGASAELRNLAQVAHVVANIIFLGELGLRMVAFGGVKEFWKSRYNRLELGLVFFAFLGLATGSKLLVLLAAVRLYLLMKYFRTLYALLKSAVASTRAIANLVVFIFIIAVCYAVAGRYVFLDSMNATTRSNFGSFPVAMLTVFQLLTGDSWSSVVYHAMNAKDTLYGQIFAACFIMSWFVFSRLIVTNLFVAVIIENFEVSETIANIKSDGYLANMRKWMQQSYTAQYRLQAEDRIAGTAAYNNDANHKKSSLLVEKKKLVYARAGKEQGDILETGKSEQVHKLIAATVGTVVASEAKEEDFSKYQRVLYFFVPNHPVRVFFIWLGDQFFFDVIIYGAIMVGCIFLVVTPPYEDIPGQEPMIAFSTMSTWNFIFTLIFTVEFITHVMADGLLQTRRAYLKSGWNIVDTMVLFFAWVDETGVLAGGSVAKVLRLARALRPLRLMKRNEGMRKVIDALIRTLAPVAYVILFSMFSFVVFSLIGMGIFGGKMFRCSTPGAEYPGGKIECSGLHVTEDTGIMLQRVWAPPGHNFDSFVEAGFTLFRVNTIKYVAIITDVMDITHPDQSPSENYSSYNSLFFIVYLIVGALFVMNLFVGFIVDGFNANKGSSEIELQYSRFLRGIKEHRPKQSSFTIPTNKLSESLRGFVTSKAFQTFSLLCVMINVVFMLSDHANMTPEFRSLMDLQNDIFLFELCAEMVLFFLAYGWSCFITDSWKGFDLFVCLGTIIFQYVVNNRRIAQFAKSFRLMRIIRLMKMIKPIRVILETLIQSVPQLLNVVLLLVLVYSMFAVVAVQSYGTTKYGSRLGKTANFETWANAMTTIYQMVTGDEWMLLMEDCSVMPPSCTFRFQKEWAYGGVTYTEYDYDGDDLSFGDCGSPFARIFFMVFMLVCESVMLNLFIGMILDNFSFITDSVAEVESDDWDTGATSTQIMKMSDVFKTFDSDEGTATMAISSLHGLMMELYQPLGFRALDGQVKYSVDSRSAERLIRAELNILVKERMDLVEEENEGWSYRAKMLLFGWWLGRKSQTEKTARFRSRVTFEEVMVTLLYWRKPQMVPEVVKSSRRERVRDAVLIMHALAIKDFMWTQIKRKRLQEVNKLLIQRKDFLKWGLADPDFSRRFRLISALRRRDKALAARNPIYRNLKAAPEAMLQTVEFIRLDQAPSELVLHHDCVRISQKVKFPKPITGALGFLSEITKNALVLKFVDVRYKTVGFVACDLSECPWLGWHIVEGQTDTLYMPRIRKGRVDEAAAVWGKVVFTMKELSVFGEELDLQEVGSLLDVQSYIRYSDLNEIGQPRDPESALRFNLGSYRVTAANAQSKLGRMVAGLTSSKRRSSLTMPANAFQSVRGGVQSVQGGLKSSLDLVRNRFASMGMGKRNSVSGEDTDQDAGAKSQDCVLEVVGYLDLAAFNKYKNPEYRERRRASLNNEIPVVGEPAQVHANPVVYDEAGLPPTQDDGSYDDPRPADFVDARNLVSTTMAEWEDDESGVDGQDTGKMSRARYQS